VNLFYSYHACKKNCASVRPCSIHFVQSNKTETFNYIRLHANVQILLPSDCEEAHAARDVWKWITTERGEQSAMTCSATLTLAWSAGVLDTGQFGSLLRSIIKPSKQNRPQVPSVKATDGYPHIHDPTTIRRAPILPITGFLGSKDPQNGRFFVQDADKPPWKIWRR